MTIDHATFRVRDLKATKDFFIKVFDLEEKPRPKMIQRIPGHWLFHKNQPFIHLIQSIGTPMSYSSVAIDHIGIKLEGYEAFKQKLNYLKIQYSLMDIQELSERRIFFRTPENILLEAVFNEKIES